jgi:N-acetylmuramic acid 6-phosphate etherase
MSARAGCSYFGVRILGHVKRDLDDLVARGYTSVLHTFSENDLTYYRGTMSQIVAASKTRGLDVQMCPWGVGRTFGGEAESRFVTMHPEACQVLDDGRRVATGCLNNPVYRAFCRDWADAAIECGTDYVFWDEPHWTVPEHVGAEDERWACRCDVCRDRFDGDMPRGLTPEVLAFREASLIDFLREMVAHVAEQGGKSTICLLPLTEGSHGVSDWDAVASLPGLSIIATDPYWKNFGEPAGPFVERFARLLADTATRHGVTPQLWLPSFGLTSDDVPELEAAIESAHAAGVEDLWTWGYEACGHMTALATPDAPLVWEAVTRALTERDEPATEARRADLADLDLRPTAELVRIVNAEDRTVPDAVELVADAVAAAVDAIAERLRGGGRLIYVGAGTSGRLAALDAAECGPTFSVPEGQVIALTVERDAEEDDADAGTLAVTEARIGPKDAVVAVSASGHTPYTVAAARAAAEAGALTVALVCARGSELGRLIEHELLVEVGPEVIAGSTRLKAGTAQKLVLNTISTLVMVRLGKTFGNLMVDVEASNEKLRARARRAVGAATGASEDEVLAAIEAAGGEVKVAIVSLAAHVDAATARARLEAAKGDVRSALQEPADVVG